ncbi:MAG TPA: helicase-associated domain-containing protein [Candidatus Nanopelagicales bacterium]
MAAPRSLADDLRARPDSELAALVSARPDLIHPVPADLGALALRAGSPGSVSAALRSYNQLVLHVALAAALGPDPMSAAALVGSVAPQLAAELAAPVRVARPPVRAAVDQLRTEAVLWGADRALHLVGAARDLLVPVDVGPRLAALDPVVAGYAHDPDGLAALVAAAHPDVHRVLDRLLGGPLVGTVADPRRDPDPGRGPIDWLLAHHLLVPFGEDRVVMPAEVATVLRNPGDRHGDRRRAEPAPGQLAAPHPAGPAPEPAQVAAGAVGPRIDLLHQVAELGLRWAGAPPARLRTGGVGARDLTATARGLGISEAQLALVIEVAGAAGLLAPDDGEALTILPTPAFDTWLREPPASRLAMLVTAWRDMPRTPAGEEVRALGPDLTAPTLPALRRDVLAALASAPGGWTSQELLDALAWHAPRRASGERAKQARAVLVELGALGLVVRGTLTQAGHALRGEDRAALEAALAQALPGEVDALVLQADLTAIVPGLPTPELSALLRLAADPESAGAASVYRFSAASVRRSLDEGRSAGELLAELGRRASVPQPLAYLIEDVARRHATLRIGVAATYLRCDDPVALAAVLADPGTAALGLVAISETVLVSEQPPEHVLDRLRALGHAPLAEPGTGLGSPTARRARLRPSAATARPGPTQTVSPALAAAAVRAMRATDRPASDTTGGAGEETVRRPARAPVEVRSQAQVMAALRAAIAAEAVVWIGYADPSGVAGDRRIEPLRITGGYLTAMDLRSESIQSFALARISGVQRD